MPDRKCCVPGYSTELVKSRKNENPVIKKCNCTKEPCPIEGKCQTENVVYQATVQSENNVETYVGLTSTTFKARWSNHKTAFKHVRHRNDTALAQHVWELKESNPNFDINKDITWKFIGRANPFSPISGVCNLCTLEKWYILFKPNIATLNKKEEIGNYCLHKKQRLLDKEKT